ncbi:MAG TPA: hypothetical protein VIK56_01285 [Rhodoferax sp.]
MQLNNFVLDAVNAVLDWDLPDEAYQEAVNSQVSLMAGIEPEQFGGCEMDFTVH